MRGRGDPELGRIAESRYPSDLLSGMPSKHGQRAFAWATTQSLNGNFGLAWLSSSIRALRNFAAPACGVEGACGVRCSMNQVSPQQATNAVVFIKAAPRRRSVVL